MSLDDLRKDLGTAYGDTVRLDQSSEGFRFSSGVVAYDQALGGGFKAGLNHLIVGWESSAKTTLALKTAAEVQKINRQTGKFDASYSDPCKVAFVDLENTFDEEWARANGVLCGRNHEDHFIVIQPSFGEQLIDIVKNIILGRRVSLIIGDSWEPVMSKKQTEISAEESAGLGGRARVLNEGYRQWTQAGIDAKQKDTPWLNTTLIGLNQFRHKITMMGDPRTIPGGNGQIFYSSTITYMNRGNLQKDGTKNFGMGTFGGLLHKNKTARPKAVFSFDMATQPVDGHPAGYVDNQKTLWNIVKSQANWCYKDGKVWNILGEEYRVQDDFKDRMNDPAFYAYVRSMVYSLITGGPDDEEREAGTE